MTEQPTSQPAEDQDHPAADEFAAADPHVDESDDDDPDDLADATDDDADADLTGDDEEQ